MAGLDLDKVWINLVSDPSQYVTAYSAQSSDDQTVLGDVIATADGGFRFGARIGGTRPVNKTLRNITTADVTQLRLWLGQNICIRDKWGLRVFGVYTATPRVIVSKAGTWDVTIAVARVTIPEGV